MNNEKRYLRDLVAVDADFKPSVQLPFDFENPDINRRLVGSFIPTSQSIQLLSDIAHSLDPNSTERARTLVGTFGTGKSDLLLIICNYFARDVTDPLMVPFYERLRQINPQQANIIRGRREGRPPYLVVLLQADTVSLFPGFVLHGLEKALERVGHSPLMNKTRYAAARERVETWQHDGHARYADFCKILEEREQINVNNLLAGLSGSQADDALPRFLRTFKAVTDIDFPVFSYSQPHEAYASVAAGLVATGTYSGILLVCDEFTNFMERFQSAIDQQLREIDSETKAVENLAERSGSSGRTQIHFIVASLESFASAAGGIGSRTVAEATERIGGRFKQHSLLVQGSEELIRGAIKRLPEVGIDAILPQPQRDDLLETAETIWKDQGRPREWIRNVIVEGAFPLHPITTYALPLINQKVAQSQRTMFLFLKDEAGLRGFIQREPVEDTYPDWYRLLTPDLLFDYFRESIAIKRSEVNDAYDLADQQLRTATVETTLAQQVIKIIALCETIGNDLFLRPTRLFLRRALNLPPSAEADLDIALNLLEQVDAVEAPSDIEKGIYRLPMRGWVSVKSLRRRITDRAHNLSGIGVDILQANYAPEAIPATKYNQARNSHRKLNAYYVSIEMLRSNHRLKQELDDSRNRDGLLWYVIATTDGERAEAQSLARELTEQHTRLVVAVPIAPSNVISALRDYRALVSLRGEADLESVNKPYLEDHGKIGRDYKQHLDDELKKLRDLRQWEWFAGGRGASGLNKSNIDPLINQLVEKVFPDTPDAGIQQHFKPDDIGNTITKAVEQILKGEIKLDRSSKAAIDSVLRKGAVSLGLLQAEQGSGSFEPYSLADPEASASLNSGKIARKMRIHLAAGKSWAVLVHELRQPTFGLYDSILILFLAHFVTRNADSLSIHQATGQGRALDVDTGLLKKMLERPQDYSIRFQPLSEHEKRWLRGLVERGLRQPNFVLSPGTTLRAATATRVKAWLSRQQLPAFAAKLSEEQIATVLKSDDRLTISIIRQLIVCHTTDGDMSMLLLVDLPQVLGAPENRESWTQATVDELIIKWITVCEGLTKLPGVLKEQVQQRAAALFSSEGYTDPATRWNAIYRWRLNRSAIPSGRLQGLAQELFRLTNLVTGSIEQTLLDDFARRVVTVGVEYQRWQDLDKLEKVFAELAKARDDIDHAWTEVAHSDDLWREGLARAVSGRKITGVSIEQVATELLTWISDVEWPACARMLTPNQLQIIYPELDSGVCHDLAQLLGRSNYNEQQWRQDLQETMARSFGVQSFSRNEVESAIKRVEVVLPLATSISARLRRHVLDRITDYFRASLDLPATASASEVLTEWRKRYTIPDLNDLSAEAKGVLFHIQTSVGDPESLLLITLPRALTGVGRPVSQWETFDLINIYQEQMNRLLAEITSYEPITPVLYSWLTGLFQAVRGVLLDNFPKERRRLTNLVAGELIAWLREQRLPAFAADLSTDEIQVMAPDSATQTIAAIQQMLRQNHNGITPQTLVIATLTESVGLDPDPALWDEQEVVQAVAHLHKACRLVESLPCMLRNRLLSEIGQVFAPNTELNNLAQAMREWRSAYIILPDDPLSSNARILYDSLGTLEDDAESLLLQRLPVRITDVRNAYGNWTRWDTREQYLTALQAAAKEIIEHGKVSTVGEHADALWREFRQRLDALSIEERRWIVKTFRDEFQQ